MAERQPSCAAMDGGPTGGETRIELLLPEVLELDEVGLAHWFPYLDGKWTQQTRTLVTKFDAAGLDLNRNWFETSVDWRCTCCGRGKPEIVRLTEGRILLAHLHLHHDHMREYLAGLLAARFGNPWAKAVPPASRRAGEHMFPLVARFRDTLVCDGCNTAEGEAKKALGADIHRHFSFAPSEVARFVRPRDNAMNAVDIAVARRIWLAEKPAFEDRLGFASILVERLASGLFAVERDANSVPLVQPSVLDAFVNRESRRRPQFQALNSWQDRLRSHLQERSLSRDGVGGARRPRRPGRARAPTDAEFVLFGANPDRGWQRTPADWSCPCCGRGKRAIMRLSGTGRWFAQIRVHYGVDLEVDHGNLTFRRALYPDHLHDPVVSGRWQRYVCSDCGDVGSELKRARPDLGQPLLTLEDFRACLGEVLDNEKTEIDLHEAADRAEANSDLRRAEWEFTLHEENARALSDVRGQFGPGEQKAERQALLRIARASGIDPEAAPGAMDWLLRQAEVFGKRTRMAF